MTLDTGALQGQPLHLPDGKVPDNQFTNWGSLFYSREANLAVGAALDGAEMSRHARRGYSRFTQSSTLQLMTTTGNPRMEIILFAYRPKDNRFWWAEWYQLRSRSDPNIPRNFFPILSPHDLSWQPGEQQTVAVIPAPDDRGRKMEMVLIDDIRQKLVSRFPFQYELPVTNVTVKVAEWRSSLYRLLVVPAGERVDPAVNDLNRKLINVIVRPRAVEGGRRAPVLFVAPTDAWWAYATNGGHDYHGWRTGYDGSVGYAPTVMSSRQRRLNNFFYSMYERFNDIHHLRYLDELSAPIGFVGAARDEVAANQFVDAVGQRLHPHVQQGAEFGGCGDPGAADLAEQLHLAEGHAVVGPMPAHLPGHRHHRFPQFGGRRVNARHNQGIPWQS